MALLLDQWIERTKGITIVITTDIRATSININWISFCRHALAFETFKDDIPVTLTSYEVDTLLAAIDYVFRVAMRNDLGQSLYSNVIGAHTFEYGRTRLYTFFLNLFNPDFLRA